VAYCRIPAASVVFKSLKAYPCIVGCGCKVIKQGTLILLVQLLPLAIKRLKIALLLLKILHLDLLLFKLTPQAGIIRQLVQEHWFKTPLQLITPPLAIRQGILILLVDVTPSWVCLQDMQIQPLTTT